MRVPMLYSCLYLFLFNFRSERISAFVNPTPKPGFLKPASHLNSEQNQEAAIIEDTTGRINELVENTRNIIQEGEVDPISAASPSEQKESFTTNNERATSPPQPQLSANDMMRALGTSPRRIALGLLSSSGIALAGNFLGITSTLLTAVPEDVVEKTSLDTYFPRGSFKRCRSKGYTFVIPSEWVADTFVELAKAQRRVQPLDYSMSGTPSSGRRQSKLPNTLPDAAYGPPGRLAANGVSESGDTNVSVIVNSGLNGFSLQGTLGSPQLAAETLLRLSIAPEGSGRTATLLNVEEDINRNAYQFEYILDRGSRGPPLRNIAVIVGSTKGDAFYTLTVVAPATEWEKEVVSTKLRKIASSFHLTS